MFLVTLRQAIPILTVALVATGLAGSGAVYAQESTEPAASSMSGSSSMMMGGMKIPEMNADRGRVLFVEKGCVMCHSINGVGGEDAPALDAHTMKPMMNPFAFAAKMWKMAPAMIAAQEDELGGQILFTGDELADMIAFVHDDEAQHHFSEGDLTPEMREMMHHAHSGDEDSQHIHTDDDQTN